MISGRYPRTLEEAFGPYTSHQFEPEPRVCIFSIAWQWLRNFWSKT